MCIRDSFRTVPKTSSKTPELAGLRWLTLEKVSFQLLSLRQILCSPSLVVIRKGLRRGRLKIDSEPSLNLLVQIASEGLGSALCGDLAEAQHINISGHLHTTRRTLWSTSRIAVCSDANRPIH